AAVVRCQAWQSVLHSVQLPRPPRRQASTVNTVVNKADVFMEIAHTLSKLGTCDRKQVGAVIIRDGRCISWGYKGAPPGLPNCEHAPGDGECLDAIHAESNAVNFAARHGISTANATL